MLAHLVKHLGMVNGFSQKNCTSLVLQFLSIYGTDATFISYPEIRNGYVRKKKKGGEKTTRFSSS